VAGAAGNTTPTDPRSRRNRASRRGGQLLTRARSSSSRSACPHLRAPGASVPDGRTIGRTPKNQAGNGGTDIFIPVTNALESLHRSLRKIIKTRGSFPSDEAATKLLYLAIRNAGMRWKRPVAWTAAMGQFAILFEQRFPASAR